MEMKFKNQILKGRAIVITRPREQAENIQHQLDDLGATTIIFPTIEIHEPESWELCDHAIQNITKYDGIIFTSVNAVRFFLNRISPNIKTIIEKKSIYVVGHATKHAVESYGLRAINFGSNAAELGQAIAHLYPQSANFLFLKGSLAGREIVTTLSECDHHVDEVVVYQTICPSKQDVDRLKRQFIDHQIDLITFFSPSSVRNFFESVPIGVCGNVSIAVIGTTTEKAAIALNVPVAIVSPEPDSESMAVAIAEFYKSLQSLKESREYEIAQ